MIIQKSYSDLCSFHNVIHLYQFSTFFVFCSDRVSLITLSTFMVKPCKGVSHYLCLFCSLHPLYIPSLIHHLLFPPSPHHLSLSHHDDLPTGSKRAEERGTEPSSGSKLLGLEKQAVFQIKFPQCKFHLIIIAHIQNMSCHSTMAVARSATPV